MITMGCYCKFTKHRWKTKDSRYKKKNRRLGSWYST